MQLIVFVGLLVGSALAANVNHHNVTVYSVSQTQRDDLRYGPMPQLPLYPPLLDQTRLGSFIFVHPKGQNIAAVYIPNGLQGLNRYPEYVESLTQGAKFLVVAYPWQLPSEFVNRISGLGLLASAGHEHLGISQLAQVAAQYSTHPIVLVQDRATGNQVVDVEQLNEVGTVQVSHDGNIQIVRDLVLERLQDPRYGAFFNPYGFAFQGYNTAYPFNFGSEFPYYGFQAHYPGYGYQGLYPSYPFSYPYGFPGQHFSYGMQAQYPFSTLQGQYPRYPFQAQYPFYGSQGQYPSYAFQSQYPSYGLQGQYPSYAFQAQYPFYGFQGQYPSYGHHGQHNYGPTGKTSPTYPGYNCYQGYNGLYPGYGGPYLYPGILGNPFGYNLVPSPYYYPYNPLFLYGQRNQQNEQQEQTTKEYSGYQYGSYPPFTLYAQQPQYQYGNQYQSYPTNYQAYPYPQPGAKSYQYTPYQFQEYQAYQYQPYQYQQYQPYHYPQYQPYQHQYYQHYQPSYGQYYPQ